MSTTCISKGKSVDLSVKGSAYDILGKDPLFDVNGKVSMLLDTLQKFISPEKKYSPPESLKPRRKGKIRQSQMNPYKFADSDLRGFVKSDRLYLSSEKRFVSTYISSSLDIVLATVGNTRDSSITQGTRMIALVAKVDSTAINYKNIFDIRGRRLALKAQNDAAILNDMDSSSFYPSEESWNRTSLRYGQRFQQNIHQQVRQRIQSLPVRKRQECPRTQIHK